MFPVDIPIICTDGGPGSGKDGCKPDVHDNLMKRGYFPLFPPEGASLLMGGNFRPDTVFTSRRFQRELIATIDQVERSFIRAALDIRHLNPVIFPNRGIPTSKAYTPGFYAELLKELGLGSEVEVRDLRYNKGVILLRSTAVDVPHIYEQIRKDNPNRKETVAEARELDRLTENAWIGHHHVRAIDNSTDWQGKLARLDQEICSILGIPVPIERERKFLCAPVDFARIPIHCQEIHINQFYLDSPDSSIVPRMRKRGQYGSYVYVSTIKQYLGPGQNNEVEKFISAQEYNASLRLMLPGTRMIDKYRHCFMYENQYFELDRIPVGEHIVYLLEVELTDMANEIKLPPFLQVEKEVTDDPHYTNRAIANLSWRQ